MKKIFVLTLIFILCSSSFCQQTNSDNSHAQIRQHDISLTYGLGTTNLMLEETLDFLGSLFSAFFLTTSEVKNKKLTHGIFLTYKYSVTHKLNIGCAIGYERISKDIYKTNILSNDYFYHQDSEFYTIATEGDFRYIKREKLQMYSGAGAGITFVREYYRYPSDPNETDKYGMFNFQLLLIGFRAGIKFSPFLELGFGYKGLVNFGLSYQF